MAGFFKQIFGAISLATLLFCGAGSPAISADIPVDLELVLAVDVSGSMDEDEHILQRQGYVTAFRHPGVVDVIRAGFRGRIAVTYFEWGGANSQVVTIPWMIISDTESSNAFADLLAERPIAFIRGTSISGGLRYGSTLFEGNGFRGVRRVIDVSGDGANNRGGPVEEARDDVVTRGITINGLPLMLKENWYDGVDLEEYYRRCVIGGWGSFVVPVNQISQMALSIRQKLILEIAEPIIAPIFASSHVQKRKMDCMIGEKRRMQREYDE